MDVFFLILVVGVIFFIMYSGYVRTRELDEAKSLYLNTLSRLKKNPSDPDLKQETLANGRAYANLTRNKEGVAIFDEIALMNDITAACAAALAINSTDVKNIEQSNSAEEKLRTLLALKEKGLIDAAEFEKLRSEILRSI